MPEKEHSLFNISKIELVYHNKVKPTDRIKIDGADSAFRVFLSEWDINKIELVEQCHLLLLDHGNSCLGISLLSTGGVSTCIVDPKIVYATALTAKASKLILAHNHPSGSMRPSNADIVITKQLNDAANFLDIQFMDHMIVNPWGYYSFAEQGLIL